MEYLEFELPIKELNDQLSKCKLIGNESNIDVTETCEQIQKKLKEKKKRSTVIFLLGNESSFRDILLGLTRLTILKHYVKTLSLKCTVTEMSWMTRQ